MAKVIFWGTGTSSGIPQLGCKCPVCTSADFRDKRLRTSVLLETDKGIRILFDCGPDFRNQMLKLPSSHLDAIFLTHEHYDHIGGLEDLRPFSTFGQVPVFATSSCAIQLKRRLSYIFSDNPYPGIPKLKIQIITASQTYTIHEEQVMPIEVLHGKLSILGYRIGNFAFITDMSSIANKEILKLKGVEMLVINALRQTSHHSHQNLSEALEIIRIIQPQASYLVHMSHQMGLHSEITAKLPIHVHLAYDGLEVHF